tara:strand:- start:349 stop:1317 length:969 start_codon:yes stop_codon:yes gene_type:complete
MTHISKESLKPFFSVIIPVYNKEKFVSRAIESVLEQEFSNFELIVVCDPSTDNSDAEVALFKDDRLRVFHRQQPGPGGYAARNMGIQNARADWVCFLDADDEWLPTHLLTSKKIIDGHSDIQFISHNYATVGYSNTQGVFEKPKFELGRSGVFTREEVLKILARKEVFLTDGVVIKKEVVVNSGMFPDGKTKRAGDVDLFLKVLMNVESMYISDVVTCRYHLEASGVVKDVNNTGNTHPVTVTIKALVDEVENRSIKKYLMIFSNRKALGWSMQRKMKGAFDYSEFKNFFYSQFSFLQWVRALFLLMPNGVVDIYKKVLGRV